MPDKKIELVEFNGKQKQVFVLGGRRFLCPVRLGAGYQDQVGQYQIDLMTDDPVFAHKLANLNTRNQEQANLEIQKITSEYALAHPVDYKVAILSALLIPETGAPMSAEEWKEFYMEDVQVSERNAVLDFFTESLSGKKNDGSSNQKSGNTTKAKKRKTQ